MTTTIYPLAASRIYSLAVAFDHGWATWIGVSATTPETPESDRVKPGHDLFLGICARTGPDWQKVTAGRALEASDAMNWDSGYIGPSMGHTTQSGTLSWSVAPDGAVVLTARVPSKTGHEKDRVIARLRIPAKGIAKLEVFGDFPPVSPEPPLAGSAYGRTVPQEYDYSWRILAHAAKACGVTLPDRPVTVRRPLPQRRQEIAAVA